MKIAFFGLGKLGLPYATFLSLKGHYVYGVDTDPSVVETVNAGRVPTHIYEPGLASLLSEAVLSGQLVATTCGLCAMTDADASIILVPTPSNDDGSFSLEYVLRVAETIGHHLGQCGPYHLVSLVSTVMPGATRHISGIIGDVSGRRVGEYDVIYSPEFVALGKVLDGMKKPFGVLIGTEYTPYYPLKVNELLVCEDGTNLSAMSWEEAELAKLGVNTALSLKPTLAGLLAELAEEYCCDVDVITDFIGSDPRIGSAYFRAGLQPGGTCLPRDLRAMEKLLEQSPVKQTFVSAITEINRLEPRHIGGDLLCFLEKGQTLGILGLAFKPGTNVTEGSAGIAVAGLITTAPVVAYDPLATTDLVPMVKSIDDLVRRSDVIAILTPCEEFKALEGCPLGDKVVYDPWGLLDPAKFDKHVGFGRVGLRAHTSSASERGKEHPGVKDSPDGPWTDNRQCDSHSIQVVGDSCSNLTREQNRES